MPVLDARLGIERSLGKEEIWRTLLGMLLGSLPQIVTEARAAHAARDTARLHELAHKLRGSCSYCGTPALEQAAKKLEIACRENDHEGIESGFEALMQEAQRLQELAGGL